MPDWTRIAAPNAIGGAAGGPPAPAGWPIRRMEADVRALPALAPTRALTDGDTRREARLAAAIARKALTPAEVGRIRAAMRRRQRRGSVLLVGGVAGLLALAFAAGLHGWALLAMLSFPVAP